MSYFRPIIDLWPSRAELAADLGLLRGTVQQWWTRDSVPADLFEDIERAAIRRGFDVDREMLLAAYRARPRLRRRSTPPQPAEAAV